MAFFRFRQAGESPTPATLPAESIELMRRRARHRLIGAVLLVLVGVVGFPLLFDTQPRPIPVDVQIDMPDRNKVAPLTLPAGSELAPVVARTGAASSVTTSSVSAPAASRAAPVSAGASLEANEQLVASDSGVSKPKQLVDGVSTASSAPHAVAKSVPMPTHTASKPASGAEPKTEVRPEPKSTPKAVDKPRAGANDDAARAQALLEGRDPVTPAAEPLKPAAANGRFIIQVGAFADPVKAHEVRLKLEHAGLKTYTHVADTKDGRRIRVRVGPFASRGEADRVAGKVKALALPAAILTL